ncbi:MAG: tripartite tricarboxylate transporter substrate binding protein [Betaproteobacteria bacterium]|nr:tripartite tricarboxylate transporter substrate binding protein [Betaproteobacteria bacterium]
MQKDLILVGIATTFLAIGGAHAQGYPSKSIRIVTASGTGGGVDTISRIVGQRLTERWKQQVVVENRPGAGGALGSEIVAKSPPDGHTLLTISISHSVIPSSHKNLSYSPQRDLVPVTVLVNAPNVLAVHPSLPAQSMKQLIALAKARPGELYYASSGNGSPAHLATELLKLLSGTNMVHVPYKGTGPGMTDVIAGRVSMMFASVISTSSHIKAGKLRVLATAGTKRAAAMPEVPTIAEAAVPGYAVDVWYAMLAPAGVPKDVLNKLNGEVAKILHLPETKERLAGIGLEPVGESLDSSAAYIQSEIAKWAKVVKAANITTN